MMHDTSSIHRQAWDLIPWIINGTASESDRKLAEPHIRGCADCHEEFELQCRLQRHMSSAASCELEADESWQALRARLNATAPASRPTADSQRVRRRAAWAGWLAAAVVAQSIALGALALALAVRPSFTAPPAQGSRVPVELARSGPTVLARSGPTVAEAGSATYHTLSSAQASAPADTIRAVLAPQTTLAQLQALLERTHLRIVSGPHEGGVWWLAPSAGQTEADSALRALRADPLVRFAASGGGAP